MEGNNNNNDENDGDQQQVGVDEADADADNAAVRIRQQKRRDKLNSVLERNNHFPSRQRLKIDELVEEFLDHLENDIHDMICDQEYENYQGLDSERDTEAEVETALRFFPDLLTRKKELVWGLNEGWIDADDDEGDYPVQCLLPMRDSHGYYECNVKAFTCLRD